ncbi:MAG: hypothetical protein NTW03_08400 [Verrucomicrobia bacterium]|nr:hypothetical protein [Verrucomicrobiota bacterium]
MNRTDILIAAAILAVEAASGQEKTFDPQSLPPGTVVHITAKTQQPGHKPGIIDLGRAKVVACQSNLLTVRYGMDTFTVAPSNLLDPPTIIEKASNAPGHNAPAEAPLGAPPGKQGDEDAGKSRASDQPASHKSLWQRIKGLWR